MEGGVVCRQLNFTGAQAVSWRSDEQMIGYEIASGPILLDNIKCTGNESYIWDCSHRGWNAHYACSHHYDVHVDCY